MVDPLTTSAVSWGFSAAGWIISPILTKFVNKCFDALGKDPEQNLLEKLDKLQTTLLPQLLILTEAAEKSPHRDVLYKWLQKLRLAFYDVQDVLGLVEYKRLEKEVKSVFPSDSKIHFKLKFKRPEFLSSHEDKTLIESLDNFEKIVNEAMKLVDLLKLPSTNYIDSKQNIQSISTPGCVVIGRDKDRDDIVKLLREDYPEPESSSNAKRYTVIGIWGMESTLKDASPNFGSLEVQHSKVQEKLRGQRFFLVLDDAWCDKKVREQEVDQVFAPFRAGKRGSKILVTTRTEETLRVLRATNPIPLRELDEKQFLSLFMCKALDDSQIKDNHVKERLLFIGNKIAAKLCRSPFAATAVAGQLRRRLEPDFWSSMLNKGLLNDTMGALYLSYQHLPPPLQRCFAFCDLFPKRYEFVHDYLVDLWIAEGFIEAEDSNGHMKDIAKQYILELISSSFFQVVKRKRNYYFMHDLMHDLAQYISQGECFRIKSGDQNEIPLQTRHLFVVSDMLEEYMEKICKLTYLCTIIIRPRSYFSEEKVTVNLDALFAKSRKLCVVDVQYCVIKRVPESVVHLRNLRYLNFTTTQADANSESLNRLYQLRFLNTNSQIPNVGRLISLQGLDEFHVKTRKGFELKQLEHLRGLSGSLSINGLQNVASKEEAWQAKLSEKKGIHKICFSWCYESKSSLRDIDVEILEGLCTPSQIKELAIKEYCGKRFPGWIYENNNNIVNLNHFNLTNCQGLEALKGIKRLSNLLSLTVSSLPRLRSWEPLPLNLTHLELSNCYSLAVVLREDLEMIMSTKISRISQIETFLESFGEYTNNSFVDHFYSIKEMMEVGDHDHDHTEEQTLSMVTRNDLKKCLEKRLDLICQLNDIFGDLSLPRVLKKISIKSCFITDKTLGGSMQGLISLTSLQLENTIIVTSIPEEVLSSLTSLVFLEIRKCLLLTSIGGWDTHRTLEKLFIECCPSLISKASVVASSSKTVELTSSSCERKTGSSVLNIVDFLGCMPSDDMFQHLVRLEHLELNNLKKLNLIGYLKLECYSDDDKLPHLEELCISKLSLLEQFISRNGFSSLLCLNLYYAQQEYFSPEECEVFHYLSSLEEIMFHYCEMRSLPNLVSLHSLRDLGIHRCENLTSLSELPPSVKRIVIISNDNEEFIRSCEDPNDPNWHKIFHIPAKYIQLLKAVSLLEQTPVHLFNVIQL
ncbi:LRR and NB-ARC domains-containing disease resistance protein [Rhynchospora pubera]|uniref:LRR and NB-ARC domains-containing disease resistance protein n=1 Tax=Rhynchospora pubera TaxID=906938 RepID=A0AAV8FXB8_9POAL|nr:LRR and NB-ARC domains-containing disease resistance protein [Rhynchospora pubera]